MAGESNRYAGIMVSSTFTDLKKHRRKVIDAIDGLGFKPVVMEHSGATPSDLITQSLSMVARCSAYVLIISHKYGQTPTHKSNPHGLSITELEFNEAVRLGLPRLLFVMSEEHLGTREEFEQDPVKKAKLDAFKARAKLADPDATDSDLTCVYEEFLTPEELATKVTTAIARLAERLQAPPPSTGADSDTSTANLPPVVRPRPPALRAIPSYGGSHAFVGRRAELESLDDWASPNDPNPILLFEAIGGTGKSMLTWHWLNSPDHAAAGDWAGRFWYSFYEQGATLAEFCQEALSYITGFPVDIFRKMRSAELAERLLAELNARRWLLVLDGIERILVGYQRLDAPQLRDEEADTAVDTIANRDPCLAIRPDDDDLLRQFAQISGSKLLVSSRLTPAAFISPAGPAISGVLRELLKGLRPADALALFTALGVEGPTPAIRAFLHANCDGHPLTVGALAGLINAYPRDHGNFSKWLDDPRYGGALNLAECNLIQKRNHILDAAIAALAPKTRELLQGLAILRGGADYDLLMAINPFLPPRPKEVAKPVHPEKEYRWMWDEIDDQSRARYVRMYDVDRQRHEAYLAEQAAWNANPVVRAAPGALDKALSDLERRGLLQFDRPSHRYDLHPVVRGVASGRMQMEDVEASGTRLVDYCQAKSPEHWDDVRTLSDAELGLQTVSALLRMGRFELAFDVYRGSLAQALVFNLEAADQALALLRGFFPDGWDQAPALPRSTQQGYILNEVSLALGDVDADRARAMAQRALLQYLEFGEPSQLMVAVSNFSALLPFSPRRRLDELNLMLAHASRDNDHIFLRTMVSATTMNAMGDFAKAADLVADLAQLKPPESRYLYRPGTLERFAAFHAYNLNTLTEAILTACEDAARASNFRLAQRQIATLRGRWLLDHGHSEAAIAPLQTAIIMAHDVGQDDTEAEAALALARLRHGDKDLQPNAERWGRFNLTAALYIAWFWQERGEHDRAVAAALRAYHDAHNPGEPYVYRWEADKARTLLAELGETPPAIPPHDAATDIPYPWEADVHALITKLNAENAKAAKSERNGKQEGKPKPRRPKEPK